MDPWAFIQWEHNKYVIKNQIIGVNFSDPLYIQCLINGSLGIHIFPHGNLPRGKNMIIPDQGHQMFMRLETLTYKIKFIIKFLLWKNPQQKNQIM